MVYHLRYVIYPIAYLQRYITRPAPCWAQAMATERPVIASQSADWCGNPFPKRCMAHSSLAFRRGELELRIPTSLRSSE